MYYIGDGMMKLSRRGGVDPVVVFAVAVVVGIAAVVGYYWWKSRQELERLTFYPSGDGGKCIVIDTEERKAPGQRIWREKECIVTETVWDSDLKEYRATIWISLEPPLERKIVIQFKVEGEATKGVVKIVPSTFSDYMPVQWYLFDPDLKDIKRGIWYTVELRKDGGSVEPEIPHALSEPQSHYPDRRPDALLVRVYFTDKPVRIYIKILYRD